MGLTPATRVALGIRDLSGRDETGQAALVTLSLDAHDPDPANAVILDRRDIDLCAVDLPPRVYHAARGLPRDAARVLVGHFTMSAGRMAGDEIDGLLREVRSSGYVIDAVSVAVDETEPDALTTPLAEVLSSHSRIHAAENALYREALAAAAADRGSVVFRYPSRSVAEAARTALRLRPDEISAQVNLWGMQVGKPWRRAHKDAALAAWLALAVPRDPVPTASRETQVDAASESPLGSGKRGR